jgi:DNA-directed RNA polymerase sigma subunit (sigma70/sigma32)
VLFRSAAIGAVLGITGERVRQIEVKALAKLKLMLGERR